MSKCKYRKYDFEGTFKCGHKASIVRGGYSYEYAEERANYDFDHEDCPECKKRKLEEEREKLTENAIIEASELGFPELKGTDKQIKWAVTIRMNLFECLIDFIKNLKIPYFFKMLLNNDDTIKWIPKNSDLIKERILSYDDFRGITFNEEEIAILNKACDEFEANIIDGLYEYFKNITSSSYYIDNRDIAEYKDDAYIAQALLSIPLDYVPKTEMEELAEEEIAKIRKEQTIYPANYNNVDVAITVDEFINLGSPKDDKVIEIAKSCGYRWLRGKWRKEITKLIGNVDDRVVEIGNKLLAEGYCVIFKVDNYKEIKDKAIKAEYEPEITRWIVYNHDHESLVILLRYGDDLYSEAKAIKGAKWIKRVGMAIPTSSYKELLDFSELYGYKLSDGAKAEINSKIENISKVEIKVQDEEVFDKNAELEKILTSSTAIIDDLKDD